jgi:hypothetical protein
MLIIEFLPSSTACVAQASCQPAYDFFSLLKLRRRSSTLVFVPNAPSAACALADVPPELVAMILKDCFAQAKVASRDALVERVGKCCTDDDEGYDCYYGMAEREVCGVDIPFSSCGHLGACDDSECIQTFKARLRSFLEAFAEEKQSVSASSLHLSPCKPDTSKASLMPLSVLSPGLPAHLRSAILRPHSAPILPSRQRMLAASLPHRLVHRNSRPS